eukprot:scaffold102398_cov19-Tisochrysis_lutea.AAC.1
MLPFSCLLRQNDACLPLSQGQPMTGDPCKQRFSCNRVLSFSMTGADTQERSGDEAKSTFIKSCVLKEKDCTSEAKN